jgi:hypothetical protein
VDELVVQVVEELLDEVVDGHRFGFQHHIPEDKQVSAHSSSPQSISLQYELHSSVKVLDQPHGAGGLDIGDGDELTACTATVAFPLPID